jgi:hypothetical protein
MNVGTMAKDAAVAQDQLQRELRRPRIPRGELFSKG